MARKKKDEQVQEVSTTQEVQEEQQASPAPSPEQDQIAGEGTPIERKATGADRIIPNYKVMTEKQLQTIINDAAEASGTTVEQKEYQIIRAANLLVNRPADEILDKADALQILAVHGIFLSTKQHEFMPKFLLDISEIILENTTRKEHEEIKKAITESPDEVKIRAYFSAIIDHIRETHGEPLVTLIDTDEPEITTLQLDPLMPEFNEDTFYSCIEAAGGPLPVLLFVSERIDEFYKMTEPIISAARFLPDKMKIVAAGYQTIAEKLRDTAKTLQGEPGTAVSELLDHIAGIIKESAANLVIEHTNTDFPTTAKALQSIVESGKKFQINVEEVTFLASLSAAPEKVRELTPFILFEIEQDKENPEYTRGILAVAIDIIRDGFDKEGEPLEGIYKTIIENAIQHKETLEATQPNEAESELTHVTYKKSRDVKSVTDKLMTVFYSPNAPAENEKLLNGQVRMTPLKYERKGSKKEVTVFYDFQYNEEILTANRLLKGFTSYDYFVVTACDNLFEQGNTKVSYSKILETMGITGGASKDIVRLADSMIKGASTIIHIDDKQVREAWGTDGTYTEIIDQVLPVKISNNRFIANNLIASGEITIKGFSPFRSLADRLGHVTTWKKEVLSLYDGRKTDRYWRTLQYLMHEIGWLRHPNSKRSNKINYSSLYAYNGDKTTRDKQLTREMLYRLLKEVFKPTGYVRKYVEDQDGEPGVLLTVRKNKK